MVLQIKKLIVSVILSASLSYFFVTFIENELNLKIALFILLSILIYNNIAGDVNKQR